MAYPHPTFPDDPYERTAKAVQDAEVAAKRANEGKTLATSIIARTVEFWQNEAAADQAPAVVAAAHDALCVPGETPTVQELHQVVVHLLCECIDEIVIDRRDQVIDLDLGADVRRSSR